MNMSGRGLCGGDEFQQIELRDLLRSKRVKIVDAPDRAIAPMDFIRVRNTAITP